MSDPLRHWSATVAHAGSYSQCMATVSQKPRSATYSVVYVNDNDN